MGTNARSTRFPDAPPGHSVRGRPWRAADDRGAGQEQLRAAFWVRLGRIRQRKTSVRASYGIFYDSIKADSVSQEGAPWAGNFQIFNGRAADPFGSLGLRRLRWRRPARASVASTSPPFPACAATAFPCPISGLFISSNLKTPYIQSWNLTVQRQLTSDIMVQRLLHRERSAQSWMGGGTSTRRGT